MGRTRTSIFAPSFALATLSIVTATSWAAPPSYVVTDLGDATSVGGMNSHGDVIGVTTVASQQRGWVSVAGGPLEALPLPPGMISSFVYDINDTGEIVGAVSDTFSPYDWPFAAVWRPGVNGYKVELLGGLAGHVYSSASAINNLGDIVGYSRGTNYRYAVLFSPDGVVDLSSTGIFDPADINDGRVMIAGSKRLDLNTMLVDEIGTPAAHYIATTGGVINKHNDVAGIAIANTQHCESTPARYLQGVGWEIMGGCSSINALTDMNDMRDSIIVQIPVLLVKLEGEGTFAVQDFIEPSQGDWVVQYWGGLINNARQIAVIAKDIPSDRLAAILLTPTNGCPADMNNNGELNFFDVSAFLAAFTSQDPIADFSGDGQFDFFDVSTFLSAFTAGCP